MDTVTSKLTKKKFYYRLRISQNRIDHITIDVPASFKSSEPVNIKVARKDKNKITINWI